MPSDDTARCPYCHTAVPRAGYRAHVAAHQAPRPDGQQADHVSLPPEERFAGDLADVPTAYVHAKCGVATVMPEEIVRSYLADPFFLGHDTQTFCCGCKGYVPLQDVAWADTGESVSRYIRRLQFEAVRSGARKAPVTLAGRQAVLIGAVAVPVGAVAAGLAVGWMPGALVGAAAGLLLAFVIGTGAANQSKRFWDRVKAGEDPDE